MNKKNNMTMVFLLLFATQLLYALNDNNGIMVYKDTFHDTKKIVGVYKVTSSETESIDIPALWDIFKQKVYNRLPDAKNSRVYVVYTNYTGDCRTNHPYTMLIGYEEPFIKEPILADVISVIIPAAEYKVAEASGRFPETIISLWDDIFNSGYKQLHTINFEVYEGDLDLAPHVEVYLAKS